MGNMTGIVVLLSCVSAILTTGSSFGESWQEGKITFWSSEVRPIPEGRTAVAYIMNADGSGVTKLTDGVVEEGVFFSYSTFSLSPDCKWAAFGLEAGNIIDVCLFEIETGRLINLTNGMLKNCGEPRWSPDGRNIVFHDHGLIYTINSDGTDVRMIGEGAFPDWSPDGQRIAFVKNKKDICTMDIDGGKTKNITKGRLGVENPSTLRWSPDGRKLLFCGYTIDMHRRIYTMDIDGDNMDLLIKENDNVVDSLDPIFSWSPSGKKIAFGAEIRPDKENHIWVMDSDGNNLERLTDNDMEEMIIDWRDPAFFVVNTLSKTSKSTWGKIKAQR